MFSKVLRCCFRFPPSLMHISNIFFRCNHRNDFFPTISDGYNSRCKRWSSTIVRPGLTGNQTNQEKLSILQKKCKGIFKNLADILLVIWSCIVLDNVYWIGTHCPSGASNLADLAHWPTNILATNLPSPFIDFWQNSVVKLLRDSKRNWVSCISESGRIKRKSKYKYF